MVHLKWEQRLHLIVPLTGQHAIFAVNGIAVDGVWLMENVLALLKTVPHLILE